MNKLIPLLFLTLICGCNPVTAEETSNKNYLVEDRQREFDINPSSFGLSQVELVCIESSVNYCTKWRFQPIKH